MAHPPAVAGTRLGDEQQLTAPPAQSSTTDDAGPGRASPAAAAVVRPAEVRVLFPNYTQMRSPLPMAVWHALRALSVAMMVGLIVLAFARPQGALFIAWRLAIPVMPLVLMLAPGVWRNVCPFATLSQAPRLFGFTRALRLPGWLREYYYVVGLALLIALIPARVYLFDFRATALALLLIALLTAAFTGGTLAKGKSGWCSTICPALPVERLYGQTPFATVPNSHCQLCVGCTKNCYDFNPGVAYAADMYDDDSYYTGHRKFFAGMYPGFVLAFYLTVTAWYSPLDVYLNFGLLMLVSLGSFYAFDSFARVSTFKLTALYGAAAISIWYWFNVPVLVDAVAITLHITTPDEKLLLVRSVFGGVGTPMEIAAKHGLAEETLRGWMSAFRAGGVSELTGPLWPALTWGGRLAVWGLAGGWVLRTYARERRFLEQVMARSDIRVAADAPLARHQASRRDAPEVTFQPERRRVVAEPGRSVLDIAEKDNLEIDSGCRMGFCGSDPVTVLSGMDQLSPMGDVERSTLERLGLGSRARMACVARVHGPVEVSLQAAPEEVPAAPRPVGGYDTSVRNLVIIGNGIAGITAADHARRRHPDCEIHVISREEHHLYNRMAITRIIYGHSGMQGLFLMPADWYDRRNINCWLNTRAAQIDPVAGRVRLATGEELRYDRLILATGSSGYVPPIEGFGIPGTFNLREANDALQMRAYVQDHECQHAVVVGGGLLGLEAAYALHRLGSRVTVVERSQTVLRRQLDTRGAELLREYLQGLGIGVVLEAEVASIVGDDAVEGVVLGDGRTLPCDLLLVSAGIRPNLDLAREAGLAVDRGVIVDDAMRTSAPNIFAAGDVAQYEGRVVGLWPTAVEQGEVAAANAVGTEEVHSTYVGSVAPVKLKVAGIDLLSIGEFEGGPEDEVIVIEEVEQHRYRRLVVSDSQLTGAILIGHPTLEPVVTSAVSEGRNVREAMDALRAGDWSVLEEPVPVA